MTASTIEGRQAYAILTWVNDDAASRVSDGVERVNNLARNAASDPRALGEVQGVGLILARLASAVGSPALSNEYADVIELHSFFNPLEPRGEHGEWVKAMDDATAKGAKILARDDTAEHAIISFGDPATAKHVITVVPGVGTAEDIPAGTKWAQTIKQEADNRLRGSNAVILWHGYKPPIDAGGALSDRSARAAGGDLAAFQANVRKVNPSANQVVVGHSYGTAVAAHAARDHGMKADDMVLLGSPGVQAKHASELGPEGHVFAAYNERDRVQHIANLPGRNNPASKKFGARILNAGIPALPGEDKEGPTAGHLSYRDPDNEINTSIARIASGEQMPFETVPKPTDEQELMAGMRNAGMWGPELRAVGFSGGIAQQVFDMSYKDAYKTELRGPDGKWMGHGGSAARTLKRAGAQRPASPSHKAASRALMAQARANRATPPGQGERVAPASEIGSITDKLRQDLGRGGIAQQASAPAPEGYVKQADFDALVSKLKAEADATQKKAKEIDKDLSEEHRADLFVEIGAIVAGIALSIFTGGISLALTTLLPFVARTLIVDKSPEIAQALARYHIVGKGHGRAWLSHPVDKTKYAAQAVAREAKPQVAALRQSVSQRVRPAVQALRVARPKTPPTPPRPLSAT